jgi:transcriptional regulator with XRE-family HTH domain
MLRKLSVFLYVQQASIGVSVQNVAYNLDFSAAPADQIEQALCERLEAIRLARNLTQAELAREAGVSLRTISRLAAGQGITLETLIRVMTALGLAGNLAALLPDPSVRPIERATRRGKERQRARPRRHEPEPPGWTWGGEPDDHGAGRDDDDAQ